MNVLEQNTNKLLVFKTNKIGDLIKFGILKGSL